MDRKAPFQIIDGVLDIQYTLHMMEPETQQRLLTINRDFYEVFADSFSNTRGRVQPGVRRILSQIDPQDRVLDLGCGNGTLARALVRTGFRGHYLGLDMSEGLLENAARLLDAPGHGVFAFRTVDLSSTDWASAIKGEGFDGVVSFAVFHHLPGLSLRRRVVSAMSQLVRPGGMAAVSVWQWQNSPRLRKRVLPWSKVGLLESELDPGDVLLDWRAADRIGLRYVHTFDEAELSDLAHKGGFDIVESFYSDGKPGNLALYQIWQRQP